MSQDTSADLLRRLQVLEARMARKSNAAVSEAQAAAPAASSLDITFLDEAVDVDSAVGSAGVTWTTFDVSEHVPESAKKVYLRVWVYADGDLSQGSVEIRAASGEPEIMFAQTVLIVGAGPTDSDSAVALAPWDPVNRSFDYQVTVAIDADFKIQLLGYLA